MDELIIKVLSAYGLAGLVIAVLGYAVLKLWKNAEKVTAARLAEQQVLIAALDNNTHATKENAAAILARNQITEDLGRAIERQATVLELAAQRAEIHDGILKDRLSDFKLVIDSLAESSRVNASTIKEIHDSIDEICRAPNRGGR